MSVPGFLTQTWRVARLGGTAALATTLGATHVKPGDLKALVVAASIAFVEAGYRAAVPAKEQPQVAKVWSAVKAVLAAPALAPEVGAAEKAIADAGFKP